MTAKAKKSRMPGSFNKRYDRLNKEQAEWRLGEYDEKDQSIKAIMKKSNSIKKKKKLSEKGARSTEKKVSERLDV